ncbi:hypothetical protein IFM89_026523 [Coptis chinensis]|uniref:cellulase n=1 Tax=Coptis chinensis TaxID=261450 RepID=A0A835IFW3_9MAGN|nr:hypothetical protein IFM89_026523 [Coptis chinensis]
MTKEVKNQGTIAKSGTSGRLSRRDGKEKLLLHKISLKSNSTDPWGAMAKEDSEVSFSFNANESVIGFQLLILIAKNHMVTTETLKDPWGQRFGNLPPDQELTWRSNSEISDALAAHVDLRGGYYDTGDNVKFNFPMAFTTTMLSWSSLEYGGRMGSQLGSATGAIRWATDYLLKCATTTPGKLYVGVGDPNADHKCWERPEDIDTVRSVYSISVGNPGSDVARAAAYMVFRKVGPLYSKLLLKTSKKVMQFA